jgi:Second Messenger Oligonucleotide or Dinucleotide Synthetase domain
MELPTYFSDFLAEIRPTKNQRNELKTGHTTLRNRLLQDAALAKIIVSTFLQGSYRRATAVRPHEGKRSDVDIVVVTTLREEDYTPQAAMDLFVPFLDRHYKGKWTFQGRSIGINLSYVDLDLVITSAPSEVEQKMLRSASVTSEDTPEDVTDWRLVPSYVSFAERSLPGATERLLQARKEAEWQLAPLRIPDRDAEKWDDTHPLEQIRWTWAKNAACSGHYVNVVKSIKWSRRINYTTPKYPKGYPLEHVIGFCTSDGIASVAEGVTHALETIRDNYQSYADNKLTPVLPDHGVPAHNVFHRVSGEEFAQFHAQICEAAAIARRALDATTVRESADEWRKLFGDKFPEAPDENGDNGSDNSKSYSYTPRQAPTIIGGGRYA